MLAYIAYMDPMGLGFSSRPQTQTPGSTHIPHDEDAGHDGPCQPWPWIPDTWHTRKSLKGKPWKIPSKPGISMENKWEFSRIDLD